MARELISIIIPVLNEAANLDALVRRLVPVLDGLGAAWEVVFVDDGSTDETLSKLRHLNAADNRLKAISLSRNFGKEVALAAGLRQVRGDAAIIIDADLQHPPEMLTQFVSRWREGYQMVYGQRTDRRTDSAPRRLVSVVFYKLFNALVKTDIPEGAGDFRLLDRKAIDAMNRLGEASRFNKGLFSWIGFKSIGVPYTVAERAGGGGSRWNVRRLVHFALDGLTSFSTLPLRISTLLGLAISLVAFAYAMTIIVKTMIFGIDVPGLPVPHRRRDVLRGRAAHRARHHRRVSRPRIRGGEGATALHRRRGGRLGSADRRDGQPARRRHGRQGAHVTEHSDDAGGRKAPSWPALM